MGHFQFLIINYQLKMMEADVAARRIAIEAEARARRVVVERRVARVARALRIEKPGIGARRAD